MSVKEKIEKLLTQLNEGIFEKEEVIRLALLSSIAGESIFLLGPPGVAKSLVARRLKFAYQDAKVFEYLMSRFSTPDEIFGPVSISKLKNEDKYERITGRYLPAADVVFLDEIWKAGPSIQNALLTVINEKKFRNGENEIDVPMKALISASNELPAKEQGLEALWDRFLVRLYVGGIEDTGNFNAMISEKLNLYEDTVLDKITGEEYQSWSKAIDKIEIPSNVFNVIDVVRKKIAADNEKRENEANQIYVSDRRWRKIVRLLRTSAFLNDRKEVDLMDCFLIKDCIWNEDGQREAVFQYVSGAIEEYGVNIDLSDIKDELKDVDDDVKKWTTGEKPVKYKVPTPYLIQEKEYYQVFIKGFYQESCNFILMDDIKNTAEDKYVKVQRHQKDLYNNNEYWIWIKKSSTENRLFVSPDGKDGTEVDIECKSETRNESFPYIKPAHPNAIKGWDKRIQLVLTKTDNLKSKIESYRKEKHIRDNLFVDEKFGDIVETNLDNLKKEIINFELEAEHIKHCYYNIVPSNDPIKTKLLEYE
ncbi:MAG: AAA family ATPase [Treponema sp.]|jgi:MoxR-like ATPase|nr:AAA family ATPase [Treponema sp.]